MVSELVHWDGGEKTVVREGVTEGNVAAVAKGSSVASGETNSKTEPMKCILTRCFFASLQRRFL
jgi:hypothetical protein